MASKLPHHQVSSRGQRGIRFCLFFCSQKAKTSSDKPLIFKNIQMPILATLLDSYPYKLVGVFFPNPKNPDRLPVCARTRIPVSPFLSCAYFTVLCTPRGWVYPELAHHPAPSFPAPPRRISFRGTAKTSIQPIFRLTWRQWTPRPIAGTLLVTRRVSPRAVPPTPVRPADSQEVPRVLRLPHQSQNESEHTC